MTDRAYLLRRLTCGAAGGLIAGTVAGAAVRVAELGQGTMTVGLFGGSPTEPALGLALALSAGLGAVVGAVVGHRPRGLPAAVGTGLLLGMLWWIVESLTVLPLLTDRAVSWSAAEAEATFGFLVGSLLYGAVTALGAHLLAGRFVRLWPTPPADPAEPRRVVVVGGGFGGVAAARQLERRLARRTDATVVLVSDRNFLLFTPMLAEVAAGTLHARHISAPVRAACPDTAFRRATVRAVDPTRRQIWLAPSPDPDAAAEPLGYDHLVLAVGAVPHFRDLPGLAEHAHTLKSLPDAERLRDHVLELLERADSEPDPVERSRLLTFTVAGGGFAGTELIAELVDLVHDVRRFYPNIDPAELRFVLVHSQDRILPELGPELADYALGELRAKGVEFLLGHRVAGADADAVRLADGTVVATRTLVWTAGNRPNPLLAGLGVPLTGNGAVRCDPTLRVAGHREIWAVGDCAAIPDATGSGQTHPPTAQHALREGKLAADNVVAALDGRPARPFRFRTIGLLVALGHQQGAAELRGRRFSGRLAWLMWRSIYLAKLPGLEKRLRVALDWTLDLFFARDPVLNPRPVGAARTDRELARR